MMALAAKLYSTNDVRQASRFAVEVDATLRDPANAPVDTIVLDLSTGGFRATAPGPIAKGASVRLGLPGLGVNPATVVWQSGNVIGCQFDRPISEVDIERAQSARTVVEGGFVVEHSAPVRAAQAASNGRLMAAGMPFAAAMTISTGITLAWAAVMVHLIQTSLVDVLAV